MIEVDIHQPKRQRTVEPPEDNVFRMLILADFGAEEVSRPVLVDRDNIEELMGKWKVSATVPGAGKIFFESLDDFHPDELYRKLRLFQALREAKIRLEDPETHERTVDQIFPLQVTPQASMDILRPSNLVDQILKGGEDPFQDYVRRLVAPYTVPRPDPKLSEMLAELDASVAGHMRGILHAPQFQMVEAAWRALDHVVRAVETGVELKIYIMDLPQRLFAGDMLRAKKLPDTLLHSLLETQDWNYICAAYTFGDSEHEIETLGRTALLMDHAKTRFLAAATPDFAKWQEPSAGLDELKQIPEIRQIGLALPRFLVRAPYEEHQDFCWANPVFACARLIGEHRATGDHSLDIRGLPFHVRNGEATPCAEFLMTQTTAEKLMEVGFMPLISMKDQDWIRLAGFRALNGAPFLD